MNQLKLGFLLARRWLACALVFGCGSSSALACASDPLVGSICMLPYPRGCPIGFVSANGQSLLIANYQALYSLIGQTFGGNGSTTFAVPNLTGRTPVGVGTSTVSGISTVTLAQTRGAETATLNANNLPMHMHAASFTPVTGMTQLAISGQPGSGAITASATTDIVPGSASAVDPASNVSGYYLTGVTGSGGGPVTTTAPGANKSSLIGTHVTVDSSTYVPALPAQTVNVPTVTGGQVSVGANTTTNMPVATVPPQLGLYACIATQGIYPNFNN